MSDPRHHAAAPHVFRGHFGDPTHARSASHDRSDVLMYQPFYGLVDKPFSLSADPRYFYKSHTHEPVFNELLAAIQAREGVFVLTGDVGVGKTMLCRAVLEHLDKKTYSTFAPDPLLSREDLLKILLVDFGVVSINDLKSGRFNGVSRAELSYPVHEFLKSLTPTDAFAVLVVDEAQNLSASLLEEIRILSDIEAPSKLLQIGLVGRRDFQLKLKLPHMRHIDQRVTVRAELEHLDRGDVAGYISHRLGIAAGGTDRVRFGDDAINEIYRASQGVPRMVNVICDRSLHRGYLNRQTLISGDIVRRALMDLGTAPFGSRRTALLSAARAMPARRHTVEYDPAYSVDPDSIGQRTPPKRVTRAPRRRRHWLRSTRQAIVLSAVIATIVILSFAALFLQQQLDQLAQIPAVPVLPPQLRQTIADPARSIELPAAILESDAVASPTDAFVIDVALFESQARSRNAADKLTAAGYVVYRFERSIGFLGRRYQVRIGGFPTRRHAESALTSIREDRDFPDARIVILHSNSSH